MSIRHQFELIQGCAEPPLRYTLADGRIGVIDLASYVRTLVESAFWLGVAPLPVRLLSRIGAHHAAQSVQRWWARGVSSTLKLQIDWQGLELIDPDEAYVVTPLHEGVADPLAVLQLPMSLRFVVRDEFADWRLLGGYLRDTQQILVRPEDGARAYRRILHAARDVFARGESVVIFPQGSILGIETDLFPGAFAVARTFQRPILPIALTGSHRVWGYPFSPRLRRGEQMSIQILPPIAAAEVCRQSTDDLRREVQHRLKVAALSGSMVSPRRFDPARDGFWDGYAYEIDPAFPELAASVSTHRAGGDCCAVRSR